MTVLIFLEDYNLAISDVMLSVDKKDAVDLSLGPISLPSARKDIIASTEVVPTRLVRKFLHLQHQIGDGYFLVAGTVDHIKAIEASFAQIRRGGAKLTRQEEVLIDSGKPEDLITAACCIAERQGFGDFEILGVVGGKRYSRQQSFGRLELNFPFFGRVTLSGSGASVVAAWLEKRGKQFAAFGIDADNYEARRHRIGNMLPSLLLEEDDRPGSTTLSAGVGGYYELYDFDKKSLGLTGSAATIFLTLIQDRGARRVRVNRILFHRYISDFLCVLSIVPQIECVDIKDEMTFSLDDCETEVISPLFSVSQKPIVTPDLLIGSLGSADFTRIIMFRGDKDSESYQTKRFYDSKGKPIYSKCNGGTVKIRFDPHVLDRIISNFPRNPAHGQQIIVSQ